jgi:ACS family D-galactonate transporter-like MFS transporter
LDSAASAAPQLKPSYTPARRWWIVALLAIASIIAYMARVNLSVAVIDSGFEHFFQINNIGKGLVNSAFFWSYAALQIPAGWIADRYGSKYSIAFGFAIWSVLTALTSFAVGFTSLFAIRLLVGVGEAIIHPASMRWIRFHFSETHRGLAIGLFMSGSKFGPAIGALAAVWLIQGFGWRAMFLILGLGALVWLIPWLALVKDDNVTGESRHATAQTSSDLTMVRLAANPIIWGTVIGTFCYMYFVYFCMTWMPTYFKEARGLSVSSSGLFTAFSFAGMAIVAILGGWAADRLIAGGRDAVRVRKAFIITGFLMASTELAGGLSSSLNVALFFSVFSLSGLGLATANYWALTQTLLPSGAIGRIVGIQNCAASVAGIVAPILTGWLVQRTGAYSAPMQTVLVVLIAGIASYLSLVREKYAPARG